MDSITDVSELVQGKIYCLTLKAYHPERFRGRCIDASPEFNFATFDLDHLYCSPDRFEKIVLLSRSEDGRWFCVEDEFTIQEDVFSSGKGMRI